LLSCGGAYMTDLSKRCFEDFAGSQNSVRTDRGSFLENVKIFSENESYAKTK
jgi:hypothetical protein